MKKVFLILFILITCQTWASDFKSPDIIVESKLDNEWSKLLVSKIRTLLSNYGIDDPFNSTLNESIKVDDLLSGLSSDSQALLRDLGSIVGLNFANARSQVTIDNFSYNVEDFKIDQLNTDEVGNDLAIGAEFSAAEAKLSADKLSLSLAIPTLNNKSQPIIQIDIVKPVLKAKEDKLITFFTQVKFQDQGNHYKLEVIKSDFDKMAQNLLAHPEHIELSYQDIVIPELKIKVGGREITFSPAKIRKLLKERHEGVKGLLLSQAASSLKTGLADSLLKLVEKFQMPKEYWLSSSLIKSKFQISKFESSIHDNNLQINMPADFCTLQAFTKMNTECVQYKSTRLASTRLTEDLHHDSTESIKNLIERENATIVTSVSEDYLNKLLAVTYDAGLWTDALEESRVELGPKKVFMRLDEEGDTATLVMDVMYKPTKIEKAFIGSKRVHFPLALKVAFRIEKNGDKPMAIVNLRDVDLSDETLMVGRPEFGIISNISEMRLQKKILGNIREQLLKLKNQDILNLEFPEFRGLGLEKVEFRSDGFGRMNAVLKLNDINQ